MFRNLAATLDKMVVERPAVRVLFFGPVRNVLMGAGIAYAIEKEKLWQLPIAVVVPSIYAGYHAYKQKSAVLDFVAGGLKTAAAAAAPAGPALS